MSFLITAKITCDVAVFEAATRDRAAEFAAVAEKAKAGGAIHHRFGVGEGFIHVIDEWETVEGFMAFFGEPAMQEFVGTLGADSSVEPDITASQALSTSDAF